MIHRLLAATILLIGSAGCADLLPNVLHPGPAPLQRARAQRTDPYPEPDTGPEVVGARPREYDKPLPENERVQNELSYTKRYSQPPPFGAFRTPIGTAAPVNPGSPAPLFVPGS